MQWSNAANAGFSVGKPWMKLNPNYSFINVESAVNNPDSIFYHYRKLIRMRKHNDILVYGAYKLLNPEDKSIYAYERILDDKKLLIVCNFYEHETDFSFSIMSNSKVEVLLSNYNDSSLDVRNITLRPYEAIIYEISEGKVEKNEQ